jgi:hypothetical protein
MYIIFILRLVIFVYQITENFTQRPAHGMPENYYTSAVRSKLRPGGKKIATGKAKP